MKKKKAQPTTPDTYTSPLQTQAQQVSEQQRGLGNEIVGQARSSLSRFAPDSDQGSAYRRALTGMKYTGAANANENAIARTRERAAAAGFGSASQPITFGAEAGLANENAARLARIPGEVEMEAIQPEMQAAGMLGNLGQAELGSARGYFGEAANMEDQRLNEFYRQQEEARKRKAGIWGTLANIGGNLASSFIGRPRG